MRVTRFVRVLGDEEVDADWGVGDGDDRIGNSSASTPAPCLVQAPVDPNSRSDESENHSDSDSDHSSDTGSGGSTDRSHDFEDRLAAVSRPPILGIAFSDIGRAMPKDQWPPSIALVEYQVKPIKQFM
jgi:hypothetical protein